MQSIIEKIKSKCDLTTISKKYNTMVITGPTATGKSDLAIELSQYLNIPIVNMDSQQFFKNYPLLTCSPNSKQKKLCKHVMYNFLENHETYSLGQWVKSIKHVTPKILTGGSMFFLYCLQQGFPMVNISKSTKDIVNNCTDKYQMLKQLLPENNLHKNNVQRIRRLLEFYLETGYTFQGYPEKYKENMFVIWIDRKNLLDCIIERTQKIFYNSLKEVQQQEYNINLESIIGYKEIIDFLNHKHSEEISINNMIVKTFKYARYQRKWKKKLNIDIDITL